MGGCRCTFRNCSSRSDGKTHMFHYPVFDKVRCHQWLTNAHKLEFLNLKLSQLKNRVVCQHHFKDDHFMNFKKDKLTFDAVPTENGPYCDTNQLVEAKSEQDDSKVFSISLDDIENEYLTIVDKKANFSVKYGDFLTNCDLMDLESLNSLNQVADRNQITLKNFGELSPILKVPKDRVVSKRPVKTMRPLTRSNRGKRFQNSSNSILTNPVTSREITIIQDNNAAPQNSTVDIGKGSDTQVSQYAQDQPSSTFLLNVTQVPIEFEKPKPDQQKIDSTTDIVFDESQVPHQPKPFSENQNASKQSKRSLLKDNKKIRIISEKKITNAVPLIGKLEPVSPTRILCFPNKRRFFRPNSTMETTQIPNNNIIDTPIIKVDDTLKDNVVLEKSASEPMNIISCRDETVFPQETRSVTNNTLPNEILPSDVQLQEVRSDVIDKFPDAELPASISYGEIKSDMQPPSVVSTKTVSSDKIGRDAINKIHNQVSTSILKSKIPPERVKAIEEKRKFNMKLRDIIEDCLDKLDEPSKSDYEKSKVPPTPKLSPTNQMLSKKQQVSTYLAKDPELPSIQDYTIAYLEARMKKMENNLLNKIEENSQKIVELKQVYAPSCEKKNVHTQTTVSEEGRKKQLYQELSKYLSHEANSLIYEELFINKYSKDVPKGSTSPKRRKRR